jgi:hypothetical protein
VISVYEIDGSCTNSISDDFDNSKSVARHISFENNSPSNLDIMHAILSMQESFEVFIY